MVLLLVYIITTFAVVAVVREITDEVRAYRRRRAIVTPKPEPEADPKFLCLAYEQREFEKKLIEAGGMSKSELTTCDDKECRECRPEKKAMDDFKALDAKLTQTQKEIAQQRRQMYRQLGNHESSVKKVAQYNTCYRCNEITFRYQEETSRAVCARCNRSRQIKDGYDYWKT